ncbi:hypothetical protein HII30_00335 [Paenibacillus lemnae]|uniref:Uncharacterized protein n=2 Tax=Paenibacillus lemnae TaxID=1330551 RepID=A0A848M3G5_PAELE|nr:hypothetical protein [Paenibacillus lemnae]
MMTYEIQKIGHNSTYSFLVLSTSYFSPLDYLDEVADTLGSECEGKILFDLLLSNGNSSNRYIEATFNGREFDYFSFKIPSNIDLETKGISVCFYKDHKQFWESNIVSNSFKFLLKKGVLS